MVVNILLVVVWYNGIHYMSMFTTYIICVQDYEKDYFRS